MVALRTIYDHIQAHLNVEIDQEVRNAARNAFSEYCRELMKQQEKHKRKEKEGANKEINEQISALTTKRKRLSKHCTVLQESAEKLLDRGEKEDNMIHIRKANSYRQTIKEVHGEADGVNDEIDKLKKKLKR